MPTSLLLIIIIIIIIIIITSTAKTAIAFLAFFNFLEEQQLQGFVLVSTFKAKKHFFVNENPKIMV